MGWVEPAHGRGLLSDAIDVLQQACRAGDCEAYMFLSPGQPASNRQAAFRLAYELPGADRIALSTNSTQHLDELLHATTLDVNHAKIAKYRELLAARQSASGGGAELVNQSEITNAARRRGGEPPASAALSGQGDHRN